MEKKKNMTGFCYETPSAAADATLKLKKKVVNHL